jgi:hypothetical protein
LKYLQTNFEELEQTERRLMKEKREAQREVIIKRFLIYSSFLTKIYFYLLNLCVKKLSLICESKNVFFS